VALQRQAALLPLLVVVAAITFGLIPRRRLGQRASGRAALMT
jgi:hypothetical protein